MNNDIIHQKCVVCGRECSVALHSEFAEVDTIQDWYKKYHPNLDVGDPVPNKCLDCYNDLKLGDVVEKRFGYGNHIGGFGNSGTIIKVYTSGNDSIYKVEYLKSNEKRTALFARVELKKI